MEKHNSYIVLDTNNVVTNLVLGDEQELVESIVQAKTILLTEDMICPEIGMVYNGVTFVKMESDGNPVVS
jgi:hypothetical protein